MRGDLGSRIRGAIDGIDGGAATGPAVLRRLRERSGLDESLLCPILHRLEADWKLDATWRADAGGAIHRTYRRRRWIPRFGRSGGHG
jgi:hypothetical protein